MTMMKSIKTYSELIMFPTFEERYEYLKLDGRVGEDTFGYDRYLNQQFYQRDNEWKHIRDQVIIRDKGCDLGIEGREIIGKILVHHIDPITKDDILRRTRKLLDPENLICTTKNTHDAIHYGDSNLLIKDYIERKSNDTCLWRN